MSKKRRMVRVLTLSALLCSMLWMAVSAANPTYKAQDRSTAFKAAGTDHYAGGGKLVWLKKDASGHPQVMLMDLATGKQTAVTQSATDKQSPKVNGSYVVWMDKGTNDAKSAYWDIDSYEIATGKSARLNGVAGPFTNISLSGKHVVWCRTDTNEMFLYNYDEGLDWSFGRGRYPVVAGSRIVYKNELDGGLSQYDIASDQSSALVTLKDGEFVSWFVYNGTDLLWKQGTGDNKTKYVILSLAKAGAKPKDVTTASVKAPEYSFMAIGLDRGAWIEKLNGKVLVRGVNLRNGEVYTIAGSDSKRTWVGFNGNDFVTLDAKKNVVVRTMTRTP